MAIYNKRRKVLFFVFFIMESGPESVSSNNQNSVSSFISAQGASVSETKASTKTQETNATKSSSVSRWNFLAAAKSALVSLRDAIVDKLSVLTGSVSKLEASAPTATVNSANTYDEAKSNFDQAKTGLESANTLADYETNMANLTTALQDMERLADPSHQTEINNIKQALQAKQEVIDKLNQLVTIKNQNNTLIDALKTTDSVDQLPAINSQLEINKNIADGVIKDLQAQPNLTNYNAVLTDAESVITDSSNAGKKLANALQTIVDAGNQSQAAVLQAQQNNSPDNIAASKQIIDESKAKIEQLKQENPDITSSPIVAKAEAQVTQAEQDIQNIKPSGSDIPIVGPSGSSVSAGSAAGALKTSNTSSGRISLLLDDVDNEMASIAMQGFRSMIEQFNVNNPATAKELQAMSNQLETLSEQIAGSEGGLPAEIQAIKEALAQALKQPTTDGLATALGQVAFAAAKVGGGSAGTAGTIQTNVKRLYNAAFASSSSSSYASVLSEGYAAYKTLNSLYSESRTGVQSAINQTANPALSRTVSRSGIESQGRSTDTSRRAAEAIVRDSRTLGDVYSRLQVLDSLMGAVASNPQANQEEIMQKLTASITKAPQFGYPAVQNSSDSLQKFAAQLEKEFVDGEQNLAEARENAFRKQPAFIQQVLVNIASLFSGYLS